jgi:hypothetical protein
MVAGQKIQVGVGHARLTVTSPAPTTPFRSATVTNCSPRSPAPPPNRSPGSANLLHPDDAHPITTALADLGYTLIPEEPLLRSYDGTWNPDVFRPSAATWWIRYFDYL